MKNLIIIALASTVAAINKKTQNLTEQKKVEEVMDHF